MLIKVKSRETNNLIPNKRRYKKKRKTRNHDNRIFSSELLELNYYHYLDLSSSDKCSFFNLKTFTNISYCPNEILPPGTIFLPSSHSDNRQLF